MNTSLPPTRKITLQVPDVHGRRSRGVPRIAQGQSEGLRLDFEHVAVLRLDAVGEGQGGRAEEMHVYIARTAEKIVLEVVVLEVTDMVRHVVLAGQELFLP